MGSLSPPRHRPPTWWNRHSLKFFLAGMGLAALGVVLSFGFAANEAVQAYDGAFEQAEFHDDDLESDRSTAGGAGGFGGLGGLGLLEGETLAVHATLESGGASWTVHPDGRVVLEGSAPWPDARDAYASWYDDLGLGAPAFDDLRVTLPDGTVLDDPGVLLPSQ